MKIAPITDNVAILIHEDAEFVFTPAITELKEVQELQEVQENDEIIWNRYWQHKCLDIRLKIKFWFCYFLLICIIGIIVFIVACGHEFCPGTGMRSSSSRHSPPPY